MSTLLDFMQLKAHIDNVTEAQNECADLPKATNGIPGAISGFWEFLFSCFSYQAERRNLDARKSPYDYIHVRGIY